MKFSIEDFFSEYDQIHTVPYRFGHIYWQNP